MALPDDHQVMVSLLHRLAIGAPTRQSVGGHRALVASGDTMRGIAVLGQMVATMPIKEIVDA